jgi:peptidoglycan/xylan/chitin deacetylase (PgdA/CDA1 family)
MARAADVPVLSALLRRVHRAGRVPLWVARRAAWRFGLREGGLILRYHRIGEHDGDPFPLAVSAEHFAQHLDVLASGFRVLSLAELVRRLADGQPLGRAVVLTFDDGYADNLLVAKPLIERHGMSATVFVITGHTNAGGEPWNDELARILLTGDALPAFLELDVQGRHHRFDLPTDAGRNARLALYYKIWRLLVALPVDVQQATLDVLRDWAGKPSAVRPSRRMLTADEVAELAESGLIEVGVHTVNHVDLSAAPASVQKAEIEESKTACEAILKRPVTSFAYPYGRVGAATPDLVRAAGFACACTCQKDLAGHHSASLLLPRHHVGDWDGDVFSARLAHAFLPL